MCKFRGQVPQGPRDFQRPLPQRPRASHVDQGQEPQTPVPYPVASLAEAKKQEKGKWAVREEECGTSGLGLGEREPRLDPPMPGKEKRWV